MESIEQTISYITYIIATCLGYFMLTAGLIGNIINILVFTQLKIFRRNQSAFYLTFASIVDSLTLILTSAANAIANSFGFDPTRTSLAWCKIYQYFVHIVVTTSIITTGFAAIDQYLVTNYYNRLRQISTFKLTQRLIGGLIIFTALYDIPFLIFYVINQNSDCMISDQGFNYYYSFVHLCIVTGLLPIFISSLFSLLAYRNVRRIVRRQIPIIRRRLDRQLTAMVLVRVALLVITALPFVTVRIYQVYNPPNRNNTLCVVIEQLIKVITNTISTANFSGSFYLFLMSSARFRRQVKYLFVNKIWRKCFSKTVNRNRILPEHQLQTIESHVSSIEGI